MEASGEWVEAQECAHDDPGAALPIVPRLTRVPKVDLDAILWPLERAARTPRGRAAGRLVVGAVFVLALAAYAGFNMRSSPGEAPTAEVAHATTPSVHEHRGLAALHRLDPHSPSGSLSRR
jgi:hypothetical protein